MTGRYTAGPVIYHGTPMTPNDAFDAVMPGRAACVSFWRPDQIDRAVANCPYIMLDNGAFSEWRAAVRRGEEFFIRSDWSPYYAWLERYLFEPGRWGVIPDAPGAPSQLNDGLLNDNPFGRSRMAPLWHMDATVERMLRLADRYDRICFGWIGDPKREPVGCDAYRQKMDEVARALGNRWPPIHMMRGVAVARDYPFRQRRQHLARAERAPLRSSGRSLRPADRRAFPAMVRPQLLRRQTGAQA